MAGRRTSRKPGSRVSPLTAIRSVYLMLHSTLDQARKERLILYNPTEDCIAPRPVKKEMQILKPEDMMAYLAGFTLKTYIHTTRAAQEEAAQTIIGRFMAQVM